jgi:hypothetical protein
MFPSERLRPRANHPPIAHDLARLLLQVRHIGPRRAQRLIDALGGDWADVLDLAPERVFRILRGVGEAQARAAAQSWDRLSRDPALRRRGRGGSPGG